MMNFWKCDTCKNYVGCHDRGMSERPLGCIPNKEIKNARMHIHALIDPLWKEGKVPRGKIYSMIAKELGYSEYHTAEIPTIEEARKVYIAAKKIIKSLN